MTNFSEIIQASIDAAYDRASIEADRLVRQELQAFHQRLEERVLPNDPDYYAHNPVGIEISESQIIEEVRDRHFIDLFVGELMEEGFGYSESHEIALE